MTDQTPDCDELLERGRKLFALISVDSPDLCDGWLLNSPQPIHQVYVALTLLERHLIARVMASFRRIGIIFADNRLPPEMTLENDQ